MYRGGNDAGIPEYLVINVMLPTYGPNPPWGKKREDGPGLSNCNITSFYWCHDRFAGVNLVLVSQLASWVKACPDDTPSIALWRKFLKSQRNPGAKKFLERLKMITRLENSGKLN